MVHVLPSSPNWYCERVLDSTNDGFLVYGARCDIIMLQICIDESPNYKVNSSANSRCMSSCNSNTTSPDTYRTDCVNVATLTRAHKTRITFVQLQADGDASEESGDVVSLSSFQSKSYLMFSGAEDGKIKKHSLSWKRGTWFSQITEFSVRLESEYQLPQNCKVTTGLVSDEQLVIGDDKGTVTCWKWKTGLVNEVKIGNTAIFCLSCSPDHTLVAVGLKYGGVAVFNVNSNVIVAKLNGHDDEVHTLYWKPKEIGLNADLLSGSKDGTMKLWDLNSRRCVQTAKLPNKSGSTKTSKDKDRLWLSLVWLPTGEIISATKSGDLLVWLFDSSGLRWTTLAENKGHNRVVFSLTTFCSSTKLISISMDRNLIIWDLKSAAQKVPESHVADSEDSRKCLESDGCWRRDAPPATVPTISGSVLLTLATLGGYVYCIRASIMDPGRLAVGVGDNLIRIWNVNEGTDSYSISTLWQGLKSKVTALCWHPFVEGQLAYGTEDGRVGMFPALSKKPPIISSTYHQKTVYVVSWGPSVLNNEDLSHKTMCVYSVGDGTILIHDLAQSANEPAQDLNLLIQRENPSNNLQKIRSDITWSPDYTLLYLGNEDGSVYVLNRGTLKCLCIIKVCSKLVNAIRLQPAKEQSSTLAAIASNENHINIVDISNISHSQADSSTPASLCDSVMILKGHKSRVTDICWSHFNNKQILSVSYDGKAIIWDVASGNILSEYKYQHGRLLTCQWSLIDGDLVFTGSDDFSLHSWRPSDYKKKFISTDEPTPQSQERKAKECPPSEFNVAVLPEDTSDSGFDVNDIQKLLSDKKAELGAAIDTTKESSMVSQGMTQTQSNSKKQTTRNKKRMGKSLFPYSAAAASQRTKEEELNDLLLLRKHQSDRQEVTRTAGKEHLGIFSLNQQNDFECFLQKEKDVMKHEGNIEGNFCLSLYEGEVESALKHAAAANALNDQLVNASSMLGYSQWVKYCQLYAQQLRSEGQIHSAVNYLLFVHDVETALLWLTESNLYREAICLARSRFPHELEKVLLLYENWGKQLRRDANFDAAVKCYVAMGKHQTALEILSRSSDLDSTCRAIRFALASPECEADMFMLCDKFTRQCLVEGKPSLIEELCTTQKKLHPYLAWSFVAQSLWGVLDTGVHPDILSVSILEHIRLLLLSKGLHLSDCIKPCAISQNYSDAKQAKVHLCEKLTKLALTSSIVDSEVVEILCSIFTVHTSDQSLQEDSQSHLAAVAVLIGRLFNENLDWNEVIPISSSTCFPSENLQVICYLWSAVYFVTSRDSILSALTFQKQTFIPDSDFESFCPAAFIELISRISHDNRRFIELLCNHSLALSINQATFQAFEHYIQEIDQANSCDELTRFDMVKFVEKVEVRNTKDGIDTKTTKILSAMLLDTIAQLYTSLRSQELTLANSTVSCSEDTSVSTTHVVDASDIETSKHVIHAWIKKKLHIDSQN